MGYRICVLLAFLLPLLSSAQDTTKHLEEVKVTDKKGENFGHMYQVSGMKIAAGKKTEVISVELLNVNKATNNTRQVYAKVSGLNIFENDGSGLQLSIGGRGLDPNRTSNFNVRQNGYDISADALGYPESYYTPPTEALKKIEIMKGAASLQYGTQFGGLLNFEMKQPEDFVKPIGIETRQTIGSFGFFSSFNAISGTKGKLSYYSYAHYKRGNGWRPNSQFESFNGYIDLHYHLDEKHMLGIEYTHLQYLSQQPGGLTDDMFHEDARQSNRERNWFAVNWNLLDVEWDYRISDRTRLQTRVNGLVASRDAVGFRQNRPSVVDDGTEPRDLLKGSFQNLTLESKLLHRYEIAGKEMTLLTGIRAYKGYITSRQGNVMTGSGPDFDFPEEGTDMLSDYTFPNLNYALFAEQIVRLSSRFTITPGIRAEHIDTKAEGTYHSREENLAGGLIMDSVIYETTDLPRNFVLGGIGLSYKLSDNLELYGNISQNYRSVTFDNIRVVSPSFRIDPAISDEKGYSADLGLRGRIHDVLRFDGNLFYLHYANRIGEYSAKEGNKVIRKRGNIGVADVLGVESFAEVDLLNIIKNAPVGWTASIYSNLALTKASYTKSPIQNVYGKEVEYVPFINWKGGIQAGYKNFKVTYQFSHLSDQYSDATNAEEGGSSAVNGLIPAYTLMDLSLGFNWKWLTIEGSVNNLANVNYFTRRATGYPGPGIIPGEGRSFYLTVGYKSF
jgi:Fe(3+) dicitrate transport protein